MTSSSSQTICLCCYENAPEESVQACTECGNSCCSNCSWEPNDSISLFNEPKIFCSLCCNKHVTSNEVAVYCPLHLQRTLNLYCLTCNKLICYDCFVLLPEHKRHPIDTVETIYQQKLMETVDKFKKISQRFKLIDWDAIRQVDDNLNIVLEVEQYILDEIHQLVQSRTSSMLEKTAEKKITLMRIKKYIHHMDLERQTMEQKIKNLNTNDFLRQQDMLNERCERILKDIEMLQVDPVTWDDIQCDLLPAIQLEPMVLNVPLDGEQANKRIPFQLEDRCGIQWITICHVRDKSFALEMYPNQSVGMFKFCAVVEISHLNQMKMTSKIIRFCGKMLPTELVTIEELVNSGFLSKMGDLRLKIGIRPENIVEENLLIKEMLNNQREASVNLEMELAAMKDQIFIQQGELMRVRCELNRLKDVHQTQTMDLKQRIKELKLGTDDRSSNPSTSVSFLRMPDDKEKQRLVANVKRLQEMLESMRITMKSMNPYAIGIFEIYRCSKDNKFYSPQLTSYNGVTIYIIIQPNFCNESNSDVNAHICWAKGTKNKCQVFLEVVNEQEEASIRQDRIFDFSKGTSFTWKSIITHYALNRDEGFLVNDHLKIQFGLRPLLE